VAGRRAWCDHQCSDAPPHSLEQHPAPCATACTFSAVQPLTTCRSCHFSSTDDSQPSPHLAPPPKTHTHLTMWQEEECSLTPNAPPSLLIHWNDPQPHVLQ
jgi:hypothetical protein